MSDFSEQNQLEQIENEIKRVEKKKAEAEKKAAEAERKINEKQAELLKAKSPSTARSKKSQMDRYTRARQQALKDATNSGTKLVSLNDKRRKMEANLREERDRETQKLQAEIQAMAQISKEEQPMRESNMIMQCVRGYILHYPAVLMLYDEAAKLYEQGDVDRHALDDMRLALEKLLQIVLDNEKSLENQNKLIGSLMKDSGISVEYRSMFIKLLDYYEVYNNEHVKHDNDFNCNEIEFIMELTCIIMKQVIQQFGKFDDVKEPIQEERNQELNEADQEEIERLLS